MTQFRYSTNLYHYKSLHSVTLMPSLYCILFLCIIKQVILGHWYREKYTDVSKNASPNIFTVGVIGQLRNIRFRQSLEVIVKQSNPFILILETEVKQTIPVGFYARKQPQKCRTDFFREIHFSKNVFYAELRVTMTSVIYFLIITYLHITYIFKSEFSMYKKNYHLKYILIHVYQ